MRPEHTFYYVDGDMETDMLCANCGAPSPDTSPFCGTCTILLEIQSSTSVLRTSSELQQDCAGDSREVFKLPAEHLPAASGFLGASQAPSFAPIAHIPFNEEPLPQPSQSFPTLIQPAGELLTFTPASTPFEPTVYTTGSGDFPDPLFVDHPTKERVPAVPIPPATQGAGNVYHSPTADVFSGNWEQDENYLPFVQAPPMHTPPLSGPLDALSPDQARNDTFGKNWEQDKSSMPFRQVSPSGSVLSNVYPGLTQNAFVSRQQEMNRASSVLDTPPNEVSQFVRPLPTWAFILCTLGGALLLAGLVFLNPDWATGALIAGVIAIIVAVLIVIVAGIRVALGMLTETNTRRRAQVVSAALLVLLLFVFIGVSLSQQIGLHAMQAHYLEGQQNWQTAVNEYQQAGEGSPASVDLARVYNKWGEALSRQQHYQDAVAKFKIVLSTYQRVEAQVREAKTNMISTYQAWANYASQRQDYSHAASYYDALLALDYCNAACQSQGQRDAATTYYKLAEQQLSAQQFTTAVNAFNVLTTRFPNAPEAGKVHADYARALWGLGQQQLNIKTLCSNAVKTYQQLANQFGDTGQGQQAATALLQPVSVTGHFTTPVPGAPSNPTVFLVRGLTFGILPYQFPPLLRGAPTTQVSNNGTFIFSAVPQGMYELVWSSDGRLHYYYAHSGNQVLYTANVGPLCRYDYGDINQTIPAGS